MLVDYSDDSITPTCSTSLCWCSSCKWTSLSLSRNTYLHLSDPLYTRSANWTSHALYNTFLCLQFSETLFKGSADYCGVLCFEVMYQVACALVIVSAVILLDRLKVVVWLALYCVSYCTYRSTCTCNNYVQPWAKIFMRYRTIMSSLIHRSCSVATPGYPPPAQRPQCSSTYSWDATSATLRRGVLLGPTFSPPLLCLEWFPPCWVRVTLTWRSPSPPLLSTSHRTGKFRSAIATYM